jgi:hemerythrin
MDAWSAALEVGNAEMDLEHRGLYDLTARAAGSMAADDRGCVAEALGALFARSEAHFEHEEVLMATSGYQGLELHVEAHRAFTADFRSLRAELDGRGLSPLFRLWFGSRFQDWLRFHIRGQDAQFYRHLRRWLEAEAPAAEARPAGEAARAGPPEPSGPARKA